MSTSPLPQSPMVPSGRRLGRGIGARLLLGVLLVGLAACASSNAELQPSLLEPQTVGDLVDPQTGRIDPAFADTQISLASLLAEELGRELDPNDRRLVDIAFDQALVSTPAAAPAVWRNPANEHDGEVTLLQWLVDPRRDALCGIIEHASRFGSPPRLEGDLTICRHSLVGDWQIDTVSFAARQTQPTTTQPTPARAPQARPATTTRSGTPAPRRPVAAPAPAPAPAATTIQEPAPTATDPDRVITRTSDQIVPPAGAGQQNLGDLLQDQAPHTPVQ